MNTNSRSLESSSLQSQADAYFSEFEKRRAELSEIRKEGVEALKRLMPIAQKDTGQAGRVAAFLLGCYNGRRFPYDLTNFRSLDHEIFQDCLAVLRMDHQPLKEVHEYFENGGKLFEKLAKDWGITDKCK